MASTKAPTIEELLETEAIKRVRILYSHYLDMGKIDELVDLFTDDGVCEFGPNYGGDWVGKERIRTGFEEFQGGDGPFTGAMHANTNPWIEITGPDTATARWYLLGLSIEGRRAETLWGPALGHSPGDPAEPNPLMLMGICDDVYRKVDGAWKIARTYIDFVWPNRNYHAPRDG